MHEQKTNSFLFVKKLYLLYLKIHITKLDFSLLHLVNILLQIDCFTISNNEVQFII